jgi:hypothetical protein
MKRFAFKIRLKRYLFFPHLPLLPLHPLSRTLCTFVFLSFSLLKGPVSVTLSLGLIIGGGFWIALTCLKLGPIFTAFAVAIIAIELGLLFWAATDYPGIIQRSHPSVRPPDLSEDAMKNRRYCRVCDIVRPSRCVHCSDCEVCIYEYDHHCPCTFASYSRFFFTRNP